MAGLPDRALGLRPAHGVIFPWAQPTSNRRWSLGSGPANEHFNISTLHYLNISTFPHVQHFSTNMSHATIQKGHLSTSIGSNRIHNHHHMQSTAAHQHGRQIYTQRAITFGVAFWTMTTMRFVLSPAFQWKHFRPAYCRGRHSGALEQLCIHKSAITPGN